MIVKAIEEYIKNQNIPCAYVSLEPLGSLHQITVSINSKFSRIIVSGTEVSIRHWNNEATYSLVPKWVQQGDDKNYSLEEPNSLEEITHEVVGFFK